MPILSWKGKHLAAPAPASLIQDAILYPKGNGYPKARPDGRVILGDNLSIMAALLPEYEGRIDLIYADPHPQAQHLQHVIWSIHADLPSGLQR